MRSLLLLAAFAALARADVSDDVDAVLLHYQVYVDAGYLHSSTQPANGLWRSKSTTYKLDQPELNLGMAMISRSPTPQSRWGFALGVQAGVDTELAVPSADSGDSPIPGVEVLQYVHRAWVSYLFPGEHGWTLRAGLFGAYPAYESFLSIDNPTYTRGYITDNVPYFAIGVDAAIPIANSVDLQLAIVTGWNYLVDTNDAPAFLGRLEWRVSERLTFWQTLFIGPEQAETDFEFWRFFSDSILEYRVGSWTVALVFDIGTERRVSPPSNPRATWIASAIWLKWEIDEHWWIGVRPEIYDDPEGAITGARQTLRAVSVALKYRFRVAEHHRFVVNFEYRYDRSTGPEGGFFSGPDNTLVSEQHLFIVALNWSFEGDLERR